jgi:hypothetical protein
VRVAVPRGKERPSCRKACNRCPRTSGSSRRRFRAYIIIITVVVARARQHAWTLLGDIVQVVVVKEGDLIGSSRSTATPTSMHRKPIFLLVFPMPINSLSGAACFWLLLQKVVATRHVVTVDSSPTFPPRAYCCCWSFCCCCCCCCCCGGVAVALTCKKEKDLSENYEHSVREKPALTNHDGCCGSTMKPSVKVSLQLLLALYRFRPRSSFPSLLPPLRL